MSLVVTLDQVKRYLAVNDAGGSLALTTWNEENGDVAYNNPEQDTLIQMLLDGAIAFVEKYCGRVFWSTEYVELINGNAQTQIILKNFPVAELSQIRYNNGTQSDPDWEIIEPDNYWLSEESGIVNLNFVLSRWFKNYEITYTGWQATPNDIVVAVCKIVGTSYNERWADGIKSETVSGDRIEYSASEIDPKVLLCLDLYKNVTLI